MGVKELAAFSLGIGQATLVQLALGGVRPLPSFDLRFHVLTEPFGPAHDSGSWMGA